jgi:hypothetical protein
MFDRPLQFGFTVYANKISYNQAKQLSILGGQNLNLPSAVLQNLQNYTQSSVGFTTSLSYPLHRSFKRVGLTYSLDRSSLLALSTASKNLFEFLAFRGISGPNLRHNRQPDFTAQRPPINPGCRVRRAGRNGTIHSADCELPAVVPGPEPAQYVGLPSTKLLYQRLWGPGCPALPAILHGR